METGAKMFFSLPLAYVFYLVIMLVVPDTGNFWINGIIRYVILIFSLAFSCSSILKVGPARLVNFEGKFSFLNFLRGFSAMLFIGVATYAIWMLIQPSDFEFSLNSEGLLHSWLISFVYIAFAVLFEELYFRSYIAYFNKKLPVFSKTKTVAFCIISGLVFVVVHAGNPELDASFIYASIFYFMMGACLMFVSIRSRGIEKALGIHFANNLISAWFVGYEGSVITTSTLFIHHGALGPGLLIQAVVCLLFCMFYTS